MRASGWIKYDGVRYAFDPSTDFGTLDWGGGVWTYDNTWHWGSGNADIGGVPFGFNIGYGFGIHKRRRRTRCSTTGRPTSWTT